MFYMKFIFIRNFLLLSILSCCIYYYNKPIFFLLNAKEHTSLLSNIFLIITTLADASISLVLVCIVYPFYKKGFLSTIFSLIIAGIIVQSLKHIFQLERPGYQFGNENIVVVGRFLQSYTFPSGHSATAFITNLYFSMVVKNLYWKYFFIILAIIEALSRVYLGVHFPFDIVIGSIIGFVIFKYCSFLFDTNSICTKINNWFNRYLFILPSIVGIIIFTIYIKYHTYRHGQIDHLFYILPCIACIQLCLYLFIYFKRYFFK